MTIALGLRIATLMPTAAAMVALAVSACAPASAPPSTASPAGKSAASQEGAAQKAPTAQKPYARVVSVGPSTSDPQDRRAHIEFVNPTEESCTISRYLLVWEDSSKGKPLERFVIPPGESRQRYLLLHPSDGNVSSLTPENAEVKLEVICGAEP